MLGLIFSMLFLFLVVKNYWMVVFIYGVLVLYSFFVMGLGSLCWSSLSFIIGGDLMSIALIILTMWLSLLMVMASISGVLSSKNKSEFMYLVNFLCLLLLLSFMMMEFIGFYFFFEASLIPIFMMIVGWGYQPERLLSGVYMLFYTLVASLPLLVAIMWVDSNIYSMSFLFLSLKNLSVDGWWWVFFILAFFVKIPVYFVHLWLPKAHVEAPVGGSMILAGVLLKLGGYGLLRSIMLIEKEIMKIKGYIIMVGLLGGLVASVVCLCQIDLKALIAYSSVGHMGFMLGGLGSMSFLGFQGSLCMMISHGLCSSGLFCLANIVYERIYSRSILVLKGIMVMMPGIILWYFLLSICNMAAPPSLGIFSELMLLSCLVKLWMWSILFVMGLMFTAGAYSIWMYSVLSHGNSWILGNLGNVEKVREYLLLFCHWVPLNVVVMKLDYVSLWVY